MNCSYFRILPLGAHHYLCIFIPHLLHSQNTSCSPQKARGSLSAQVRDKIQHRKSEVGTQLFVVLIGASETYIADYHQGLKNFLAATLVVA